MKRLAQLLQGIRRSSGLAPRAWCQPRRISYVQWNRMESGRWVPKRMATILRYATAIARNFAEALRIVIAAQDDAHLGLAGVGVSTARTSGWYFLDVGCSKPVDPEEVLLETLLKRIGKVQGGECEIPLRRKI